MPLGPPYAALSSLWLPPFPAYFYQDTARTIRATQTGHAVASWADGKTSRGRHATQSTSAKRPTLVLDAQNGRPALRFDGVDDYLATASYTRSSPLSLFLVLRQQSWGNSRSICDSLSNYYAYLLKQHATTPGKLVACSLAALPDLPLAVDCWSIVSIIFDGASSRIRVNGGTALTGDTGGEVGNGMVLGGSGGHNLGSNCAYVDVGEVMEYSAALSPTQEMRVISWLDGKWKVC